MALMEGAKDGWPLPAVSVPREVMDSFLKSDEDKAGFDRAGHFVYRGAIIYLDGTGDKIKRQFNRHIGQ